MGGRKRKPEEVEALWSDALTSGDAAKLAELLEQARQEANVAKPALFFGRSADLVAVLLAAALVSMLVIVARHLGAFEWVTLIRPAVTLRQPGRIGATVVSSDLVLTATWLPHQCFSEPPESAHFAAAVKPGQLLCPWHLHRLQAVATRDLPAGTPLDVTDVDLAWTTYDTQAYTQVPSNLQRLKAARPIRRGAPLTGRDVVDSSQSPSRP